ncbi:MAG: MobA/MobL family protein [Acidiferrobacteraceae bacterium]
MENGACGSSRQNASTRSGWLKGESTWAAAAYRSRSRLHDERTGRTHDFRRKGGLAWSEILLPAHAPESLARRGVLWNEAEAAERRVNARVAREVRMALPRELSLREQARLTRRFLEQVFVARAAHYAGISRGHVSGGDMLVETQDAYVLVPYAGGA